jgi:hypothetical protein
MARPKKDIGYTALVYLADHIEVGMYTNREEAVERLHASMKLSGLKGAWLLTGTQEQVTPSIQIGAPKPRQRKPRAAKQDPKPKAPSSPAPVSK